MADQTRSDDIKAFLKKVALWYGVASAVTAPLKQGYVYLVDLKVLHDPWYILLIEMFDFGGQIVFLSLVFGIILFMIPFYSVFFFFLAREWLLFPRRVFRGDSIDDTFPSIDRTGDGASKVLAPYYKYMVMPAPLLAIGLLLRFSHPFATPTNLWSVRLWLSTGLGALVIIPIYGFLGWKVNTWWKK
jgi:hypothetical protein